MSKELEALKRIENKTIRITYGKDVAYYRYGDYLSKEDLVIIEKSLKALEIIKEKEVNISDFIYACKCSQKELKEHHNCDSNYELACDCVGCEKEQLTQKEYDLLKEVLL